MTRATRPISWISAARKDFESFPEEAQDTCAEAPYCRSGGKQVRHRVVHAFQKKSTQGIKTPKHEIDLVKARIKRLKEMLK